MQQPPGNQEPLILSYLNLRQAIGYLGVGLPFVVSLGAFIIFDTGIQSSISSYYYTGMRDVLVGTLWVIAFFLLSYQGYAHADAIAGRFAFVFALGTSLFPTAPDLNPSSHDVLIGNIHLISAGLFFATLIYFSLYLFTKTDPNKPPTPQKLQRNKVYRVCGYVMAICVLVLAIYNVLLDQGITSLQIYHPIYWLEAVAIIAFGISWLTKGQAILKDGESQIMG